jgi:Uma2 family endonuclease
MESVVLKFTQDTQFSDDELFVFCASNPDLRIERNKKKELVIMSPVGGLSSSRNNTVSSLLWIWNNQKGLGVTFDSSCGFRLPDNSMLSPDAAFVSMKKWEELNDIDKRKFPPIVPDFVIEVRSESDSLTELQDKMSNWIKNGCLLAWLIDPIEQKVYIYDSNGLIKTISSFQVKINGEKVLPGFDLDLSLLKNKQERG